MRLLGYQNPTGRCQGCPLFDELRSCCDNRNRNSPCNNINGFECDSFFTYCLRTFGSQDSQEGGCSNRDSITSDFNINDNSVTDFSRARVLGLDNPFLLQGLENSYIVSVSDVHVAYVCLDDKCKLYTCIYDIVLQQI